MSLKRYFIEFEEKFKSKNINNSYSTELSWKFYQRVDFELKHTLKFQIWSKVWSELIQNIEEEGH
jgi:hypothetical protein